VTLFKRLKRGEKVWEAHREYYYQQAMANGLRVIEIVTFVAISSLVFAVLAISIAMAKDILNIALMASIASFAISGLFKSFSGRG
jgi:hypothetical protein